MKESARHLTRERFGVWTSASAVAISLMLFIGLSVLILTSGLQQFWPKTVSLVTLTNGEQFLARKLSQLKGEVLFARKPNMAGDAEILENYRWVPQTDIQELRSEPNVILIAPDQGDAFFAVLQPHADVDSPQRYTVPGLAGVHEIPESAQWSMVSPAGGLAKMGRFVQNFWQFLSTGTGVGQAQDGIFPAILGTSLMVLLMSVVVTPLGVLAAFFLFEFGGKGWLTRLVRIGVRNLAGVPSVVYGVFGLGLFVYQIGGRIDQIWYADQLPAPTFGTGGLLWASLVLALLTLPVVIVTTEEALQRIPKSLRESALSLGATRSEALLYVLLPIVRPAILTGLILAIARAAGEVAPLMLVGVAKLTAGLPIDGTFPYLHVERKFMHLGFHIYDMATRSVHIDQTGSVIFAATLVLLLLVWALNMTAIILRTRLQRQYQNLFYRGGTGSLQR